ncbi:hypothetical protein Hamer_G020448 [Homarus americanus]|uniref:Uncharacterized protein n=1 Tax=Homarus americanus TaxID=6706 RepID=A0A8J5K5U8_HOMAM|nr:hypothetical protein Hamer_G020448 [Homarus americanus]
MLEIIKSGARTCEIMCKVNCPKSTVRSLKKNKEALTASVNVFSRFSSDRTFSDTSQRNLLLVITEHYLHKWVERRNREQDDLSEPQIRHQARVYYAAVAQKNHVNSPPPFNDSPLDHEFVNNVKLFYYQSVYKDFCQHIDSLVELQQFEAELSDSDQALPAPANQEEMVDDPTPSTSHAPPANGMEEYKALYMPCVNARQQTPITRYLRKAQPVNNGLANITLGDDDGTTDDDIEELGDLLVEELPQDFEGFDTEVRGGVEEGAGRKQ